MLNHIELYVSNLNESKNFYSYLLPNLGYNLYQEWESGFSYKYQETYIVFVQVKKKYLDNSYNRCNIGLNHLAFNCFSENIFSSIRTTLIKSETNFLYEDRYPYAGNQERPSMFFEDPDRIKIEIILNKEGVLN